MQRSGDVQVIFQLILSRLQGGDAPATKLKEEMHARHVGEVGGLAGTEPARVEKFHRHGHTCLTLELAFGNVKGTKKRFGV